MKRWRESLMENRERLREMRDQNLKLMVLRRSLMARRQGARPCLRTCPEGAHNLTSRPPRTWSE